MRRFREESRDTLMIVSFLSSIQLGLIEWIGAQPSQWITKLLYKGKKGVLYMTFDL